MVKVSIEVSSGAAHFDVAVQAESIRRAMSLVRERYPKGEVQAEVPDRARELLCGRYRGQVGQIECEEPQEKTAA